MQEDEKQLHHEVVDDHEEDQLINMGHFGNGLPIQLNIVTKLITEKKEHFERGATFFNTIDSSHFWK
jgi:hypothetical protein